MSLELLDSMPGRDVLLERLDADLQHLAAGNHPDPHRALGLHVLEDVAYALLRLPDARHVRIDRRRIVPRVGNTDFFLWTGPANALPERYRLSWIDAQGGLHEQFDPYCFPSAINLADLDAFTQGRHSAIWRFLGAHVMSIDGVTGTRFAVWAPHAAGVSVTGAFSHWEGARYPMRMLGASGVWELFIPGLDAGVHYRFEIRSRATGMVFLKSDPCARASEVRPATASIVTPPDHFAWTDADWLARRARFDWLHEPMSIYEVHLGSWRQRADGGFLNYRELAGALVPYVKQLGFTHIELLPITEHPLDDSWGYQTTGYFAPTSRHGSADELRYFIDRCHAHGIGVLLDWVPAHFPRDAHALARFDGEALYEYSDPRRAEHRDWGTLVFDYERPEVRAFLKSSAAYWLAEFHFDGLRVDAVASMVYLDFSQRAADFVPNRHGGNHNLEAIELLRELNTELHAAHPGAVIIAEESSDWPGVSRPASTGGLGFSMKWNMGWMHDTLAYWSEAPDTRGQHHNRMTFAMVYAYRENFVLALSHDEVVHLKRSLLGRMPADAFAHLRMLLVYQWTFPGKKLLFMGGELGQTTEWDFRSELPWALLEDARHAGVASLLRELNQLYISRPCLHRHDFEPCGFDWVECDDAASSVFAYVRRAGDDFVVVVLNFRADWEGRVGVPALADYRVVLDSNGSPHDDEVLSAAALPAMRMPYSLPLRLAPFSALMLAPRMPLFPRGSQEGATPLL